MTASPRSGCSSASVGAGRVNPWQTLHAEAYRAAHGPRARCPLGCRGAAREGSLGGLDAFLLRNRIGVPLVVGGLLKRGSLALFVRSVPTTRYEESSWVPWRGCDVEPVLGHPHLTKPAVSALFRLQTQLCRRAETCCVVGLRISYISSSAVRKRLHHKLSERDCCIHSVASKCSAHYH